MNTKDKEKILAAIKAGRYEVEIEEADIITTYTKYDGTPFLRIKQNSPHQGSSLGYCRVNVNDTTILCDLEDGQWYFKDKPIHDTAFTSALEQAEGVISGAHRDGFSMCELYAQLNNLPEDIDFCMENEEYCLKDVNDLGGGEADIVISYAAEGHEEEWNEMYATISDGDLYEIYKLLKRKGVLPTDNNIYEMYEKSVRAAFPDLYDEIIELINEENEDEEMISYKFTLLLSHDTFELGLYGE